MKLINEILKGEDCPHCSTELEYQCAECEIDEMHLMEHYLNLIGLKDNFNAWAVCNKDDELNFFDILEECQ
tara:strand:- start:1567 stop:1779 length:213 start_codon:yes stop_codon:yes gene_type:complete